MVSQYLIWTQLKVGFLKNYTISNTLLAISVQPKDPDDLVEIVERLSKTEGREETLALLRALQKALR